MVALTDRAARSITPGSQPIADSGVTGLRLHPGKSKGHGQWKLRYVSPVTHKRRDMGLGSYPDVGVAQARSAAHEARQLITQGKDPIDERKSARSAAVNASKKATMTFERAARQVHADRKAGWKNAKHAAQWINTLSSYVFPFLGNRPVETLTPQDFAAALRPLWLEKAETASRVKQRCNEVMEWCWAGGYSTSNPVSIVHRLLPKQPSTRQRVQHLPAMPWRDIPEFIEKNLHGKTNSTRALMEFVILTAARSGEARPLTWHEIDFSKKVWNVPATRMKTGNPHRVPLSNRALELLEGQKKKYPDAELVFPAPRGGVLTDMALTSFLRKKKAKSDVPDRHATAHGFRSAFRDWASENGYARDLAERALAHTIRNQAEAAYHRTDLLEQRRPMMENWAEFVSENAEKSKL